MHRHSIYRGAQFGCCLALMMCQIGAAQWTQFRGPNGMGISIEKEPLPAEIGPDTHLLWRTEVAPGISSPVIAGGRVYLTAIQDKDTVETVALDAENGSVLWQVAAPGGRKVKGERLATATPVTDGERVIGFFDACGLVCYDTQGKLIWQRDFGPVQNQFNHAASPILVEDRLIHVLDHDGHSLLIALDKKTGEEIWRCDRFVFGRNYSSPILWNFDDKRYVVVSGSGLVTGYDVETGEPAWYIRATSAVVNPTPVVSPDQSLLFIHSSSPTTGAKSSPFGSLLKEFDADGDGGLQSAELPQSFLKTFYARFDGDNSGGIDEKEYSTYNEISRPFATGLVALRSGGTGERTDTNIAWTQTRSMPRTPSAICHDGVLFVVNEGGILQSIDTKSGDILHKGRIGAKGTIYSSPALGDGKIYIGTLDGEVAVVSAEAEWKNLHAAKLDGEIQACPSIAGGRVYIRTKKFLYCFGESKQ